MHILNGFLDRIVNRIQLAQNSTCLLIIYRTCNLMVGCVCVSLVYIFMLDKNKFRFKEVKF